MNQNFNAAEKTDPATMEMKSQQRRDMQLPADEILNALDTASPAGLQWKAARRFIGGCEESKFAAMAGIPIGAEHGVPARD